MEIARYGLKPLIFPTARSRRCPEEEEEKEKQEKQEKEVQEQENEQKEGQQEQQGQETTCDHKIGRRRLLVLCLGSQHCNSQSTGKQS